MKLTVLLAGIAMLFVSAFAAEWDVGGKTVHVQKSRQPRDTSDIC